MAQNPRPFASTQGVQRARRLPVCLPASSSVVCLTDDSAEQVPSVDRLMSAIRFQIAQIQACQWQVLRQVVEAKCRVSLIINRKYLDLSTGPAVPHGGKFHRAVSGLSG